MASDRATKGTAVGSATAEAMFGAGPAVVAVAESRPCYHVPAMNPLLERITIDPEVCGGRPCIRGTRIWVSLVLDLLAGGMTEAELLGDYPQLSHEDVLAAIAYGAEAARERIVPVPVAPVA